MADTLRLSQSQYATFCHAAERAKKRPDGAFVAFLAKRALAARGFSPQSEWIGMPEYEQDEMRHRSIAMYFKTEADVEKFAKLVGQTITRKTKSLWYPHTITESITMRMASDGTEP